MGVKTVGRTRDPYWDSVKFSLICCVVYIHTLITFGKIPGSATLGLHNFFYFFSMPLFIFISGRFTKVGSKKKYIWGIIGLLETYFLFQVIQIFVKDCIIGHGVFRPTKVIFMIQWTLWYLLALVIMRLLIWCIPEHIRRDRFKLVLAISLVISLLVGFIPLKKYSMFIQTFALMPYFFLGYYSNKVDLKNKMERIPSWAAVVIILLTLLLFCCVFNDNISKYFDYGFTFLACPGPSVLFNFGFRIFHFIGVVFIGIIWMRIIPGNNSLMSKWGQGTLTIYMFHPVILLFLKGCLQRDMIPANPWWALPVAAIIVAGIGMLSNFEWMKMILSPITYWVKKRL
ncbi:MAG: acyltransferase [Prevotella sp.]|nr:acyltransferase [Prevotella sp.]